MSLKNTIRKALREETTRVLIKSRNIVNEQKTETPKNSTYTTQNDHMLQSMATFGSDLKIPKGTRFTAHQTGIAGGQGMNYPKYWVSVDRTGGGKLSYSTIFWCSGDNKGKFWNAPSQSWYTDEKKVLSNYLTKNLCYKAYGDQYRIKNTDKWNEQAQNKKEEELAKNSPYVDNTGKKVLYYKSTEYQKNYNFFKSQGLVVDGLPGREMPKPNSPNQHYNLVALFSIKYLTDYQINRYGWNNTECMRIGLSFLNSVNIKSNQFQTYSVNMAEGLKNPKSPAYSGLSKKVEPMFANFVLSDFYFKWGELVKDINARPNDTSTSLFPDGVYNFMAVYYGGVNVNQLKSVFDTTRPACKGGGLTSDDAHKIIGGLQLVTAFIPVVGPFIAAGLGAVDAGILYNQGRKTEAGITFALSVIPFAAEIPALKNVGQNVMKSIATKTISKLPFNPEELKVVQIINKNANKMEEVAEKWITTQSKNPTVQHFMKTAKDKGEDVILDKISERTGVPVGASAAQIKKQVGSKVKSNVIQTAQNIDKSTNKGV